VDCVEAADLKYTKNSGVSVTGVPNSTVLSVPFVC